MDRESKVNFWYFVIALIGLLLIQQWWAESRRVETIAYSEFEQLLESGAIAEIQIKESTIRGKLKQARPDGTAYVNAVRVEPDLAEDLGGYGVEFTGVIERHLIANILSWLIPVIFFIAIWMFFIRNIAMGEGAGGLLSVGKSKAKIYVEKDTQVNFDDVAGVDEAKEELQEIIGFLKDPTGYGRLGAHVPKGVLLVGPPGTGKTLLARAVAGEAGVPFFSISGSEFVELFVGVGAARVRDLFEQARLSAPCIIFIDELDALGRARGAGPLGGGHDEKEQTLNQLLSELDGFDPQQGIVFLAATNRPEILDPALLRAGRFDRQILVDRPDKTGRIAILGVHVRHIELADDVSLEQVAALTAGFSGADLANLVNEAAIVATRRDATTVAMTDFTAAIERIVAGLEKKTRILNPQERRMVAYHEVGHALVTLALPGVETVHKVSIIPRGIGGLGYNIQRPTEDRYLMTRDELRDKMTMLLGGRAAEMLVLDQVSTGAADDLAKATEIARGMVMRYGMDENLGQATYSQGRATFLGNGEFVPFQSSSFSEATAQRIDESVRALLAEAFDRATAILTRNHELLEETAAMLLERETLTAADLPQPVPEDDDRRASGA